MAIYWLPQMHWKTTSPKNSILRHSASRPAEETFLRQQAILKSLKAIAAMPKKILIVTDDAGESLEIYYAKHRFLEAGYQPVIAATVKKRLHGVIHDFDPDWN